VEQFRTEYVLAADRRLLIALRLAGAKSVRVDEPAVLYRHHAGSATINPSKPNLQQLSHEYFRMAAELAEQTSGKPSARRIFLAWHAIEGAKLVLRYLHAREFAAAGKVLGSLVRRNRWLPVSLVRGFVLRRAVRNVIREDERRFRAGSDGHQPASTQVKEAQSYVCEG
jgi:hypothetical protein